MKLLDRLIIASYIRAYVICLVSLLSLYIVIDLFTNLDDFAQDGIGLTGTLRNIVQYYSVKVVAIFDRLCEAIVLLAAMFTVAWMQRNNEMLPLLSAGVPIRRILQPVLIGAALLISGGIANQELLIPQLSNALLAERDDFQAQKAVQVQGVFDTNGVHIEGLAARRKEQEIDYLFVTLPDGLSSGLIHLVAKTARYIPPGEGPKSGGWLLIETTPPTLENWTRTDVLEPIDPGKYFLYVTNATMNAVTRHRSWYMFASTTQLKEMLDAGGGRRSAAMAVLFHSRLTRPILGMLLVTLGLAVILRDQTRNVFISAGLCLIMCVLFFGATYACKYLGENDYLAPALAAWLPVLVFGPLAVAQFDAIHT